MPAWPASMAIELGTLAQLRAEHVGKSLEQAAGKEDGKEDGAIQPLDPTPSLILVLILSPNP